MPITLQTLKACRDDRRAADSLQERIERLRSAMEMAGTVYSHAPGGGHTEPDRMAANMARLQELAAEYVARLAAYMDKIAEVEAWVDTLPEGDRAVMRARYVDDLGWREVASRAHYSARHCIRVSNRVLRLLTS